MCIGLAVSLCACTGSFSFLPPGANPTNSAGPSTGLPGSDDIPPRGNGREPCAAATPSNRWATFRQLTRSEYVASAQALAETSVTAVDSLPADGETRHETAVTSNIGLKMDDQRFANFSTAAQRVAKATIANLMEKKHCVVSAARSTGSCLNAWISNIGARAFRRPLSADELGALTTLNRSEPEPEAAAALVVEALALSPQFLFHVELGASTNQDRVQLSPFELAARLSYFITGGPPSDALFNAARGNLLETDEQRGQWAKSLLASEPGQKYQTDQVLAWLGISNLERTEKSPVLFPEFTPALKAAMKGDAKRLVERELLSGAYGLSEWLSSNRRYFDTELESFYSGPNASRRIGPLMQPAWLSQHSAGRYTAPTKRGKFITERMLCQAVKLPPPGLTIPPIREDDGTLTTRERFESHGLMPCAAGCHRLMDPLGFALESFDAIGRPRERENNKPVNTAGEIEIKDVVGPFNDAADLIGGIAKSTAFFDCVTEQWVERALSVPPRAEERCQTEEASDQLRSAGGSLESLIVSISRTAMFRTKGMCTQ